MPAPDTAPPPSADPIPQGDGKAWGAIAMRVLMPALGAVVGYLLLARLYLPTAGPGSELQRIPELARFAVNFTPERPTLFLLGDSLLVEGVDASIIERDAPKDERGEWAARNLALNAHTLSAASVELPTLLAARPAAVLISIRPEDLGALLPIPTDRAYAYAYAGFVDRMPRPIDYPGLTPDNERALTASRFAQVMRFRSTPLRTLDSNLRFILRRDLREPDHADWTAPFNMTDSITGPRLERHIREVSLAVEPRMAGNPESRGVAIEPLVRDIREANAIPIVLIPPQHPALRETYAPLTAELFALATTLAAKHDALVIDASDLFGAEGFADALHPNAQGRAALSSFIAQRLPKPPQTPGEGR